MMAQPAAAHNLSHAGTAAAPAAPVGRRRTPGAWRDNACATAAPVTAIVAYDPAFHEHLPAQYPANPAARDMFAGNAALALDTATRNGTLQGAYLILAARALGLDTGPMSGFNAALLNEAFFADGRWRANFLVNLGWGDAAGVRPRGPRLAFGEVARIE